MSGASSVTPRGMGCGPAGARRTPGDEDDDEDDNDDDDGHQVGGGWVCPQPGQQ